MSPSNAGKARVAEALITDVLDGGEVGNAIELDTEDARAQCTTSSLGRKIRVGVHEAALTRAREEHTDPIWRGREQHPRIRVRGRTANATSNPRLTPVT